jgi:A/G-specific adenine glycosylase
VLDGNVERVLCRVFYIKENPKETRIHKKLWALARALTPVGRASFFNQALMDLGATICVPRNPQCLICPLSKECGAFHHSEQDILPVRVKRKPTPHYEVAAGIIWKQDRLLIDRRKPQGLLGGLWEFPGGKCEAGGTLEACLARGVREDLGIKIKVGEKITAVDHAYTHFRITLHVFGCKYLSGRPQAIGCAGWKWIRPEELKEYPLPKANHKVIAVLRKGNPLFGG